MKRNRHTEEQIISILAQPARCLPTTGPGKISGSVRRFRFVRISCRYRAS